jgi:hypothetical protein
VNIYFNVRKNQSFSQNKYNNIFDAYAIEASFDQEYTWPK